MIASRFRFYILVLLAGIACSTSVAAQSLPAVSGVAYDGRQISWNAVDGATGYNIYFNFDYFTTAGDTTEYTPVVTGTYSVVAYNDQGQFSPLQIITNDVVPTTNSVSIDVIGQPPSSASALVEGELALVTGASFDGTTITWDSMPGATGYNVHYFYPNDGWQYLATVGNATSYEPQMIGSYNIVSYDTAGNFSPFQVVEGATTIKTNSVTIESFNVEPTVPPPLAVFPVVTGVAYDGQQITWNAVEGAIGYNIHINNFEYLDTVLGATSFQPPIPGTYYIVAFDEVGNFSPIQVINDDGTTVTSDVTVGR